MTPLSNGLQLLLRIGRTEPVPAPYDVMAAFVSAQVVDSVAQKSAFTLTFTLGRSVAGDYALLRDDVFAPLTRVVIAARFNGRTEALMDGVVTEQQVASGARPGEARLVVTGEDLSRMLDLRERRRTFANRSDSAIVSEILGDPEYATFRWRADVEPTTIVPAENRRLPSQQYSDLATINELARRNDYVFYFEPTTTLGKSVAYWGPELLRSPVVQPALTVDMGPWSNVDAPISFRLDAMAPTELEVKRLNPDSRERETVSAGPPSRPPLAAHPVNPLRFTVARRAAPLDGDRARQQAETAAGQSADAVSATGEVDAVRYGGVLRARRLVGVRGVGQAFGGNYYVRDVRHDLTAGRYRMSFTLAREGLGSNVSLVRM